MVSGGGEVAGIFSGRCSYFDLFYLGIRRIPWQGRWIKYQRAVCLSSQATAHFTSERSWWVGSGTKKPSIPPVCLLPSVRAVGPRVPLRCRGVAAELEVNLARATQQFAAAQGKTSVTWKPHYCARTGNCSAVPSRSAPRSKPTPPRPATRSGASGSPAGAMPKSAPSAVASGR